MMGSGNNDVGNATPTRKHDQPAAPEAGLRIASLPSPQRRVSVCGAMSQQGGGFRGDFSAPQKFVHLVGCHDGKIGRRSKARQIHEPIER